MPILIRACVFLILVLAAMLFPPELLTLNVLALLQWHPPIANIGFLPSTKVAQTCTELRKRLGSEVVQVYGERVYVEAIHNPASLFNSIHRPACVVAPWHAVDVQMAMEVIYRDRVRYAVMSGGHTGMTGWNTCVSSRSCSSIYIGKLTGFRSVQDGVLIFFGNMSNITYDAIRNRATIEPGVRWGDALEYLEQYGVAAMGGRLG